MTLVRAEGFSMDMLEIEDPVETRRVLGVLNDALDASVATYRRIGASLDEFAPSWRGEERMNFAKTMEEFAVKAARIKQRTEEICEGARRFMDLVDRSSEFLRGAKRF